MKLKFWGVSGSIPSPDAPPEIEYKVAQMLLKVDEHGGLEAVLGRKEKTVENIRKHYFPTLPASLYTSYGRETSCAEVRTSDGKLIILDIGSGARKLGVNLMKEMPLDATVLMSHQHWDHIQGLPFFLPAYIPGNQFAVYGMTKRDLNGNPNGNVNSNVSDNSGLEQYFELQMSDVVFPVPFSMIKGNLTFYKANGPMQVGSATITTTVLNHPDPSLGYRIEDSDKVIVYASDHEHCIPSEGIDYAKMPHFNAQAHENLKKFAQGADVLIYDGQYTPEEYNPAAFGLKGMAKIGWGHSTYKHGIDLALEAGVKKLIISHHEPAHTDAKLDEIKYTAREYLAGAAEANGMPKDAMQVVMSYEGMEIQL